MKYLRSFNENVNSLEIDAICKKYGITNYNINEDGSIDVEGDVDLYECKLTKLPLKFRNVYGNFYCNNNELITLEGCPVYVIEHFDCKHNKLTTLNGAPKKVLGNFICQNNDLETLKGGPEYVGSIFDCSYNNLKNLKYSPKYVGHNFYCISNNLVTLSGCTQNIGSNFDCSNNLLMTLVGGPIEVGDMYDCSNNQLTSMKGIPKIIKSYLACRTNKIKSLDYMPKCKEQFTFTDNPINNILKLFIDIDFYDNITSTQINKDLIYDFIDREIIQNDILIIDRLVEFLEDIGKPYSKEELYELLKKDYTIR